MKQKKDSTFLRCINFLKIELITIMKKPITVFLIIFFIVISLSNRYADEAKNDLEKFLENIKQSLQKATENQAQEKKTKKKELKSKIRKQLREKISTPYKIRKHIINPEKNIPASTTNQLSSSNSNGSPVNTYLSNIVAKTVRTLAITNPAFLPLTFPTLEQIKKKADQTTNKSIETFKQDKRKEESEKEKIIAEKTYKLLQALVDEVHEKLFFLWSTIYKLLNNRQRLLYIKNKLCIAREGENKSEMDEKVNEAKEIFLGPGGSILTCSVVVSRISELQLDSSCQLKLFNEFRKIFPSSYRLYKNLVAPTKEKFQTISLNFGKSLCYNISAFTYLGSLLYLAISPMEQIDSCLEKGPGSGFCNISGREIRSTYKALANYFTLANKLYTRQILPTYVDLCYLKCQCEDLGIKCNQRKMGINSEVGLKDILTQLSYSILWVDVAKKIEVLMKVIKKMEDMEKNPEEPPLEDGFLQRGADLLKERCNELRTQLQNLRSELIENLRSIIKNSPSIEGELEEKTINPILNEGKIVEGLTSLSNISPSLFLKFITSDKLNPLLTFFDKLKNDAQGKKDICSLIAIAMFIKSEDNEKGRFLGSAELEGILFILGRDSSFLQLEEEEDPANIEEILEKLQQLPYRIYQTLAIYKLKKCGYDITFLEEDIEQELTRYDCIFKDKSLDVSCVLQERGERKYTHIKEILKGLNLNLENIDNLWEKVENQDLKKYSQDLQSFCSNDTNICANFYAKIVREDIFLTKDSLEFFCTRNKQNLSKLTNFCPVAPDFKECPTPYSTTGKYCYKKERDSFELYVDDKTDGICHYILTSNCVCKEACADIYHKIKDIWKKCCKNDDEVTKSEIKKENFCEIAKNGLEGCCNAASGCKECKDAEGNISYWMFFNILDKKIKFCSPKFAAKMLEQKIKWKLEAIENNISKDFLSVLKERIKNLKQLWNNKETCKL